MKDATLSLTYQQDTEAQEQEISLEIKNEELKNLLDTKDKEIQNLQSKIKELESELEKKNEELTKAIRLGRRY